MKWQQSTITFAGIMIFYLCLAVWVKQQPHAPSSFVNIQIPIKTNTAAKKLPLPMADVKLSSAITDSAYLFPVAKRTTGL